MILYTMRTGRRENNRIADDRGISLVELIIVITIMVVMTGLISIGVSLMFSRDASYVAGKIDDELSEARMYSMSKAGTFTYKLHIVDPRSSYVEITDGGSYDKVVPLDKDVNITVSGTDGYSAGNGDEVNIVFDKAKGSVKTIDGNPASGVYTITIVSQKFNGKTKDVTLIATTGRHYTEK